uniref:Peptidase M14 domain-containing protein n=1 Tax=Biomphalaria glabrata TaxID=6526 RepID=A0A2C9JVY0_BIOGL
MFQLTMRLSAVCLLYWLQLSLLMSALRGLDFRYHGEEEMVNYLRLLNKKYPNMTKVYSIGKSVQGRELWVLAIGKHVASPVPLIPNVRYIGNIHGNEVVGRELLLHLAEHYLTMYSTNSTIQTFLDSTNIHLLPCMNPDGFHISKPNYCDGIQGRNNSNNFDLNRNFPDSNNPRPPPIQPETAAVIRWVHSTHFVLSANLHGGAMVVNYPLDVFPGDIYSTRSSPSPDDDVFVHLSLVFSRSHANMYKGNHCDDHFLNGITNGAEWYPVLGGMQDFVYKVASGYEVLIEISCCKYPRPSELPKLWIYNKDALINFMMTVHIGVKGIIYGESVQNSSGVPLKGATVSIKGRDIPFYTTSRGEYYKLLLPGNYVLMVSHPLYESYSTFVKVQSYGVTRKDILLSLKSNHSEHTSSTPRRQGAANSTISTVNTFDTANSSSPASPLFHVLTFTLVVVLLF